MKLIIDRNYEALVKREKEEKARYLFGSTIVSIIIFILMVCLS
jgi:hypothetical protein